MSKVLDGRPRRSVPLEVLRHSGQSSHPAASNPIFSGHGTADYLCGSCGTVLCKGMEPGQLQGLVIRCRCCGSTSRVPPNAEAEA